jgi:hypothetical protein
VFLGFGKGYAHYEKDIYPYRTYGPGGYGRDADGMQQGRSPGYSSCFDERNAAGNTSACDASSREKVSLRPINLGVSPAGRA